MSIKDLFLKLTKSTMPGGHETLVEKYLPKGWKKDFHGNYYIKIGDPTTMFTSHVDTADSGQPKEVNRVIKGDKIETDGKTILGADDKAGTAIMIKMIEKGVTGLYYFFLNEERGCVGSRALNTYLDTHKDDELYKKITKVVALDRRDFDSVITFQVGERCCSEEFANELAKRLNDVGGFKYKPDPTGSVTDSHHVAGKFSECTNLSVGYDAQHTVRENQDIAFLTKLADACCKIDWETLPTKRDHTKTEYSYSNSSRRNKYYGSEWDNDRWWEGGGYQATASRSSSSYTPTNLPKNAEFVTDYLGNQIKVTDAQWCEYDKAWCDKKEAIWVDYIGFYTCPDFDPSKVKKASAEGELIEVTIKDIKKDLEVYSKNGELFGTITAMENDNVTISTEQNSKFICPPNKFLTYGFKMKSGGGSIGNKKLTAGDLKEGLPVLHPSFGEGKIVGIRPDKVIVKVMFKGKGEKDLRVDVADMKF